MSETRLDSLSTFENWVIAGKGTEPPFSGIYVDHFCKGRYLCRRCRAPLFLSDNKFQSHCGWPSFDAEIPGAVKRQLDADGQRTEILCAQCEGHLGHVFSGETFTSKNERHCVNSISLTFQPSPDEKYDHAFFAAGCFWGVQHHFARAKGVVKTEAGYMGGTLENPTYEQICTGTTGHLEVVEVTFDHNLTTFEALVKLFFEIHDFTQTDGQGPDLGPQYHSAVFFTSDAQKNCVEHVKGVLEHMGYKVATQIARASSFFAAESEHQHYYTRKAGTPYCHVFKKIFSN